MGEETFRGEAPQGRLDDRVLLALEQRSGRLPFSGLRRTLGAHPESLSRSLHRLEREGLVERSQNGYRSTRSRGAPAGPPDVLHTAARIDLPPGVTPAAVLERLTGRWFGSLRWMGVVERSDRQLLAWTRRDGTGTVLLGAERGEVRIYTTGDGRDTEASESEAAAYEVLVAVAEVLRPASLRPSVTFFAAERYAPSGSGFFRTRDPGAVADN